MGKNFLNKESILSCPDLTTQAVDVPEWGGQVLIQSMTAAQREFFEISVTNAAESEKTKGLRALLVSLSVVDDQGKYLFSHADLQALSEKSANAMDRLVAEIQKLNKLSAKEVETAEGN